MLLLFGHFCIITYRNFSDNILAIFASNYEEIVKWHYLDFLIKIENKNLMTA